MTAILEPYLIQRFKPIAFFLSVINNGINDSSSFRISVKEVPDIIDIPLNTSLVNSVPLSFLSLIYMVAMLDKLIACCVPKSNQKLVKDMPYLFVKSSVALNLS